MYGFPYVDTLKVLEKFGPGATFYGFGTQEELDDLERRCENGEKYLSLFCEFPGNPLLKSPDLKRIRAIADKYDIAVVVDETIGNFLNIHVLPYADVVVSSLTKVFSGDSNVMGGTMILNPQSRYYAGLKKTLETDHSYPGTVKTGIANELTGPVRLAVKVMYAVMTPWILNVRESGERHFFQMTNKCYPAAQGGVGIEPPDDVSIMRGSNGQVGSGAYLIDWDGKPTGDENVLKKYRDLGMPQKVWEHTMAMFQQAERLNRKDGKRPASREAEGAGRPIPDPVGWRPA
ncbi:hypothetical protein KC334_g15728 [Hortaea werneckii]|nr:hypothetical protein KC334_g15728 [Hortaea werneckii]KAI6950634.1 hypothetical protein KC355_g14351 [Hortaea werneckii]